MRAQCRNPDPLSFQGGQNFFMGSRLFAGNKATIKPAAFNYLLLGKHFRPLKINQEKKREEKMENTPAGW